MTRATERLQKLREEIREVRESILAHVVRMDDIRLQQIPQIRADYALKIGCWEQALLEAELAARRAKRRLALAQAQANRGVRPQMDDIEAMLDEELAEWMSEVERARLAYEHALSYRTSMVPMRKAAAEELKRVYRILAKRLHPDMHGGQDKERAALFLLAQGAYRNGDIETMRSLEIATRHLDSGEDDLESADGDALEMELELARIEEGVMRERLSGLEQCEEMRLVSLLTDPDWVTRRTTELRQAIEGWNHARRAYEARLQVLREDFDE